MKIELVDENIVRKVAKIMGDASGAAAALRDLDQRRAEGEVVAVYKAPGSWWVGPDVSDHLKGSNHA